MWLGPCPLPEPHPIIVPQRTPSQTSPSACFPPAHAGGAPLSPLPFKM